MNERIYKLDMRFRIVSAALAVIFLLSYQLVPSSADIVPLSIEEMTEAADVILIGTVEEILHYEASPYTIPKMNRQVTVSVERYLKNPLETKTVTVVDLEMWALLAPEFQESERVLLFLRDDPTFLDDNPQGFYQVVGLSQGKYTVSSDSAISDSGHVIENGLRVGDVKFNLGASLLNNDSIVGMLFVTASIVLLGVWARRYAKSRRQGTVSGSLRERIDGEA